ncbi:transposase family protein [Auritidibacter ignavus]|uniref:integrase catalytic domain-containing protein n=1 Tax=Auritidibacter ignavus TaxID=678932 RepID=UPI00244D0999|nr:transposase family protein [Auritidibacter ignavus]WGH82654.1 transposase family protein [Auritidibacter ignavus]
MSSRIEITKNYATAYTQAPKKPKAAILDTVTELTGWNPDHARQQLTHRTRQPQGRAKATVAVIDRPKTKARKYSYDAVKILPYVCSIAGGICGKYLVAAMKGLLDCLEAHRHLIPGKGRYNHSVRAELLAMSPATINRYLKPVRDKDPLPGKSATKPGSLLRNSITVPKAGDELDDEPGFFEIDTLAHCGPTLNGEFARCVNDTDMHTGWVYTHPMKNNASTHVVDACTQLVNTVPYLVTGLDFDNGSEFINHNLNDWAADRKIFFTRARPDTKNDQATIESKNNHLVRRYGFSYRYDTAPELELLQRLWPLVNDRLNFFTPRKKPTGYSTDRVGRPQTRLRLCQDTVSTIAGFRDPQRPAETRASEVPGRSGSGRPGCRDRSNPATVDQARCGQDCKA